MRDEIVEEVRRVREAYAEKFHFDLEAIFQDLKERERASGREYVTLPPRRIVPSVGFSPIERVEAIPATEPISTAPQGS